MTPDTAARQRGGAMHLRSITALGNIALGVIALVACGALVILTTVLRGTAETVMTAFHEVQLVDSMRVNLLAYARESDLAYVSGDASHDLARSESEAYLLERANETRTSATSTARRDIADQLVRRVHEYLVARHRAELHHNSLQEVLREATPALESALGAMDRLVRFDVTRISATETHASRWDRIGNIIGVATGFLLLAGFLTVTLTLNRLVLVPLLALSDGIDRFAGGDRQARVKAPGTAEIQHTIDAFNDMADRIQRQQNELRTFLAGIAHDLRNPLSALRLSVESIQPERALPPEVRVRETFALVGRQVSRLERMVDDFLDVSRIEAGQLELALDRCDVRELVREVHDLYASSSPLHRVILTLAKEPLYVRVDPHRIAQVLNNLVSNAIKYSPAGGDVKIDVSSQKHQALISVSDCGIGISETDVGHIFEPFRRTAASRESIPGVGLGLSVARRIVEAQGGRIEVDSRLREGSTFRLLLPIDDALAPADVGVHHVTLH